MAQAARQSLRMQKELKLLLTDPPPGASFPFLSPLLNPSPSLSSIDADIEGPEGTVYAKGIFRLKIQIPERYPFQPPIVTFATPIYHPNIDNGGRICLDILNLPPKGAWQPSLNISTVLTSIGLLLSEPNPDDGLMCEASREYKYNRHTFDEKARSMTEKFARAGANEDYNCSQNSQAQPNSSTVETKGSDVSKSEIYEDFVNDIKFKGKGSKLSLERTKPQQVEDFEVGVSRNHTDDMDRPKEGCKGKVEEYHQHHKNLSWTKRKLSLGSLGSSEYKVHDNKEAFEKKQNLSYLDPCKIEPKKVISHYNERLPNGDGDVAITQNPQLPPKGFADKTEDNFSISKRKKLGLASKWLSLGLSGSTQAQQTDNKENHDPAQSLPLSYTNSLQLNDKHNGLAMNIRKAIGGNADFGTKHEPMGKLPGGNGEKQQEMEGSILPESVIVLDSEDSEEETKGPLRSRLSLARKRLAAKSKPKVDC